MHFLLDQCIPRAALETLLSLGMNAEMITNHIAPDSDDRFVVQTAALHSAIVVSHDRDFKSLIARRPDNQKPYFRNVHLIKMDCKQARIGERLNMALPIFTAEYHARQSMKDKRVIIWVSTDMVRVWR